MIVGIRGLCKRVIWIFFCEINFQDKHGKYLVGNRLESCFHHHFKRKSFQNHPFMNNLTFTFIFNKVHDGISKNLWRTESFRKNTHIKQTKCTEINIEIISIRSRAHIFVLKSYYLLGQFDIVGGSNKGHGNSVVSFGVAEYEADFYVPGLIHRSQTQQDLTERRNAFLVPKISTNSRCQQGQVFPCPLYKCSLAFTPSCMI